MGETTVGHVAGEVVRALYGAGYMESTIGQYRKSIRALERYAGGPDACFASMFVRQVRQCFSAVWADGFPRCRHRFPVM